jgi:transcription factor 25
MFAFERSFTATFNFTTGLHRLDFSRIENRAFFLALHRHITNLLRRGTMRTAFEFSRLLLSLDPHADPHGALFYLDYLAPKAGMNEWLVGMWDTWGEVTREIGPPGPDDDYEDARVEVESLPGWMWSRALARWNLERGIGDSVS